LRTSSVPFPPRVLGNFSTVARLLSQKQGKYYRRVEEFFEEFRVEKLKEKRSPRRWRFNAAYMRSLPARGFSLVARAAKNREARVLGEVWITDRAFAEKER
jgi:hypothetical protein